MDSPKPPLGGKMSEGRRLNFSMCKVARYIKYLGRALQTRHEPAGGRGPLNTIERSLQGLRDGGWLSLGILRRLWLQLFRVRGGFACPFRWFAFGVAFGRPKRRRFRLSLTLVRVWCWF